MWATCSLWPTNRCWVNASPTERLSVVFPKRVAPSPSVHLWYYSKCKERSSVGHLPHLVIDSDLTHIYLDENLWENDFKAVLWWLSITLPLDKETCKRACGKFKKEHYISHNATDLFSLKEAQHQLKRPNLTHHINILSKPNSGWRIGSQQVPMDLGQVAML